MRFLVASLMGLLCVTLVNSQYPTTTPVPILKQINRHNEDGSFVYGYESADGSFKIETKQANGEVRGKYGFVDDLGQIREVEYGASRRGFEPSGTGINVPPSLSGNEIINPNEPEDDGEYREDPSVYYTDPRYTNGEKYESVPANRRPTPPPARRQYQPAYQQYQQQQQQQQQQQAYQPTPVPSYQNYQQYEPAQPAPVTQYQNYQPYQAKSSVNLNTASYSVQY